MQEISMPPSESSINLNNSDDIILTQLDWKRLSKNWSTLSHFVVTQNELEKIPIFSSKTNLDQKYQQLENVINSLTHDSWKDVDQLLRYLPKDLNVDDFKKYFIKYGILSLEQIHQWVLFWQIHEKMSSIGHLYSNFKFNDQKIIAKFSNEIKREIRSFITLEGEILYEQHPLLREIFLKIVKQEEKIKLFLKQYLKDKNFEFLLIKNIFELRNNHYVVPFRSDRFEYKYGRIIDRSDSGFTLYVELHETIEMNKTRQTLFEELEREIYILAQKYTEKLHQYKEELVLSVEAVLQMDLICAKAKWSSSQFWVRPKIVDVPCIKLHGFYHPLVSNAVKNDFEMAENSRVLLISGPNTGGKSVILKSMAIIQLLLQSGMYLPAREAILYSFPRLFYLAQDQQNLNEGLSSFAAEVKSVVELMKLSPMDGLVIVDEIFHSTSSEEASILAYATINFLFENTNLFLILSSHHHRLKILINENKKFASAHVGIDEATKLPTYKLILGSPGSSHAAAIFSRMLQNSGTYLRDKFFSYVDQLNDHQALNYEDLLRDLDFKRSQLDHLMNAQERMRQELKNELQALKINEKTKLERELAETKKYLLKIKQDGLNYIQEIKSNPVTSQSLKPKKIEQHFWQLNQELLSKAGLQNSATVSAAEMMDHQGLLPVKIDDLIPQQSFYCTVWHKKVVLESIACATMAYVLVGKMKSKVPISSLFKFSHKVKNIAPQVDVAIFKSTSVPSFSFDARGMRLEEFTHAIDKYLGHLLAGDLPFVEVIHGHGDGVLKKYLRDLLKNSADFIYEIPDHSSDGCTKVQLKIF